MIVLDSSFVVALLSERDQSHARAAKWYADATSEVATTPLTLMEIDYFAAKRAGGRALVRFRRDVRSGAYVVHWWNDAAIEAAEIADRYADLGVSMTDASLVALAARLGTIEIATFDERHFRAMQPLSHGTAFRLLPADA